MLLWTKALAVPLFHLALIACQRPAEPLHRVSWLPCTSLGQACTYAQLIQASAEALALFSSAVRAGPEASLSVTLASGRTLPHLPLNRLFRGAPQAADVQQEPSHEPSQEPAPEEVSAVAELILMSIANNILTAHSQAHACSDRAC